MEHKHTYLTTTEAADYVRTPAATLNTLRCRGGGPPFIKRGSRVLYRRVDLDDWLLAELRTSTSDVGNHNGNSSANGSTNGSRRPQRASTSVYHEG